MAFLRSICFLLLVVPAFGTDLDVTKVVLYKHGIGYFERGAAIPAGESAVLRFRASEMDDVLKSLTVEQTGGQGVSAIRYDSSDPLSKRLEVFPFQIERGDDLAHILDQFKGAEIEIALSSGALRGVIVSARRRQAPQADIEVSELLLMLLDGEIRSIDPSAAQGLNFTDTAIQAQFRDYLSVLARSRGGEKKTVTVESQGGASRMIASYVVPTPIWKSTYRLVLDASDEPLLEGWAIVDNTSGEDWSGVALSLVSGLPVSFTTQLYEPRYLTRPRVELAQNRTARPVVHQGVIGGIISGESASLGVGPPPPPPPAAAPGRRQFAAKSVAMEMAAGAQASRFRNEASSTVASTAVQAELGDLFEYRIDHPVTISKGESAMLPFFREKVSGRRLLIYSESGGSQHPLNAVEVSNSTGATLDGGAITVYDAGAYAGEALIETVKDGDKRLISYAVDLGSRITTKFDSSSKLQSKFRVTRGVMTLNSVVHEVKTFTIKNVDKKAKTVVIEHPARSSYKLVGVTPKEKTADSYRFEVAVAAGEEKIFAVTEERVVANRVGLSNLNYNQIVAYVSNRELDAAGRAKLKEISDAQKLVADTDASIARTTAKLSGLEQDQGRLRNNISTLRSVTGQQQKVQEYADKLASQEGAIVAARDGLNFLRIQKDELQARVNELITNLEI
jgi:hypothetical protein